MLITVCERGDKIASAAGRVWGAGAVGGDKIKNSWARQQIQREIKAEIIKRIQVIVGGAYNPIFYKYQIMSYIIDQLANPSPPRTPAANSPATPPARTPPSLSSHSHARQVEIIKSLGRYSSSVVSSEFAEGELALDLLLNNVFRNISIILKIKLTLSSAKVRFHLRLLAPDAKPLTIAGRDRRLLFCKVLASRASSASCSGFKTTVSMLNGQVRLLSPLYDLCCDSYASLGGLVVHISKILKQNIEFLYGPVNFAREGCGEGRAAAQQQPDERVRKLLYYSQFTSVAINLALDSTTSDERTINQKHQKEMQSITQLKDSFVSLRNRNGLELFAVSDFAAQRSQVANFDITLPEREQIAEKTAPPNMQKNKNPLENNFVLNYVRLSRRPDERQLRKIHTSNFTSIHVAEIEYWYVGSYNGQQAGEDQMPPHKKYVVVKREEGGQRRSRIAHEKLILMKIKDGMSMFLPKYYINVDRSEGEHELMADFLNYPSLADYSAKNRETMSYQTKIYLGYIIAQGLRYLQEYQIAHLDLKPSNIMLFKKMMVKLIDFGESYHPDVKDHHPGFSVPYSAPENYLHPARYSHKNDVFSLGVILHELFLSRFPFHFADPLRRDRVYRSGSVSDYWLCAPEGCVSFGENTIFPILQLLIGKCLSPNPDERPELEWAVLILRDSLDYLY